MKQEPELKLQTVQTAADSKALILSPSCQPQQQPTGPPHSKAAPQVKQHLGSAPAFLINITHIRTLALKGLEQQWTITILENYHCSVRLMKNKKKNSHLEMLLVNSQI